MTSFAQTKSIELPVLGRSPEDWRDGLAHAAEWAMAIDHARKAYPALDQNMTLYLTQCCSPGALKVLNSLIRGKGSEELDEAYPDDMNLTTSNAANVTALRKFHDEWFEQVLESCAVDQQILLVRQIERIPFPTPARGCQMYSAVEIAPYIAQLHTLFERLPEGLYESMSVNNEIRDAVYRQLPTTIRNLIKNQRPHGDDDFSDNWITICDALAKSIHLAESAAPAVQAFTLKTNFTPRPILTRPFPAPRIASVETSKGANVEPTQEGPTPCYIPPDPALKTQEPVHKTLTCKDCQARFDFTVGEHAWYQAKGYTEPARCPSCREKAKNDRKNDRAATTFNKELPAGAESTALAQNKRSRGGRK